MRATGIIVTFAVGFCLAWIAVLTLGQPAFHQTASVRVFFWQTPAVPIFYYLGAALAAGLLVGLAATLYTYFAMAGRLRQRKKALKQMEATIDTLKTSIGAEGRSDRDED